MAIATPRRPSKACIRFLILPLGYKIGRRVGFLGRKTSIRRNETSASICFVTRFPSVTSLKVGLPHAVRRTGRIMKSTFAILVIAVLLTISATSLRADDWKTTDGKVYQNVQIVGLNPDAVTILHQDGGASVPLANLPADIQKRFNYDPAKAEAAAEARAERNRAAKVQQAEPDAQDTQNTDATVIISSPANNNAGASTSSTSCNPSPHYSIDDLASSIHSLGPDPSDPTHSSIGALASSMHSLRSDPSDSNHHSISEIADSGL